LNGLPDLSAQGWTLVGAAAINDLGQITASVATAQGVQEVFMPTPAREPGTLTLIGVALLGVAATRCPEATIPTS